MQPAPADPLSTAAQAAPPKPGGSILERVQPARSIWRHKFLALGIMTCIAGLGLPVAWKKGKPVFYAEAVIYISPRFLKNLEGDKEFEMQSNSQYREYVQQQVRTINRFDIVSDTYKEAHTFHDRWALPKEPERRGIERLQGALSVKPIPDTYQVTVGLESDYQEGLSDFVNALVNTYLKRAKADEFYASDVRTASLKKEADQLSAEIQKMQQARTEMAQELGVSIFSEGYNNPYDRILAAAKEVAADARRKRIEAEATVKMLEDPASVGKRKVAEAFAAEMASKDPTVTSALAPTNNRRSDLLSRLSGLGDQHPDRLAAQKEMAEIAVEQRTALERFSGNYVAVLLDQRHAELKRARQVEATLLGEAEHQQSQAAWFVEKYQTGIAMGLQIERARKRLDSIDDRIRFLAQEGAAPGFARMFSAARPPDMPARGGRKRLFLMCCVAAAILGIVVPVGIDVLDPRIFSLGDAGRALGFEPMGWLPQRFAGLEEFYVDQTLRIAHRMDQERTLNSTRVWCFTGAQSGSGTTATVAALGSALCHLGIRALTVEANAWRSDPSFRGRDGGGLAVVLRGNSSLLENIEPAGDAMPDHLPLGELDGKGHLPDIHRLMEVLGGASSAYDVVLVDLPPILASVDTEYLAGRADIVVLVLRAVTLTRGDLASAVNRLQRNQPKAVAALLNGVSIQDGPEFAMTALEVFRRGKSAPAPRWKSPWLWS